MSDALIHDLPAFTISEAPNSGIDMPRTRHVIAVACRFDWDYFRCLIQGVGDYCRITGHRCFPVEYRRSPRSWSTETTAVIYDGDLTGIARWVRRCGLRSINVGRYTPSAKGTWVRPDDVAVARIAAEHLLSKGLRDLAFIGLNNVGYSDARRGPFKGFVAAAGVHYHEYLSARPDEARPLHDPLDAAAIRWLRRLPKPVGILACNDDRAIRLLECCRRSHLRVPEEVAIIGVDNDMLHCAAADPPLSTIDLGARRIGYEAARILIESKTNPADALGRLITVPPRGLIVRHSSEIMAIQDSTVLAALRYIREHIQDGLRVKHLVAVTQLSRRTLEQRFKETLGRSPAEEIRRVQLERARMLLASTSAPMKTIAEQSGFSSARQFGETFLAQAGMTPTAYRRQFSTSQPLVGAADFPPIPPAALA